MKAQELERMLNEKISGTESNLAKDAIEIAVLQTQIASVDETLYIFRDLAGSYLRDGNGNLMARYREYKYKLDALVNNFMKRTGRDLTSQLKCNR